MCRPLNNVNKPNLFPLQKPSLLVWRSGNGVRHIKEVTQMSSPVSVGIGDDLWRVYHPGIYPSHSGPLSLAIPPWPGWVGLSIYSKSTIRKSPWIETIENCLSNDGAPEEVITYRLYSSLSLESWTSNTSHIWSMAFFTTCT